MAGRLTAMVMYAPIFGLALIAAFSSAIALDLGAGAAYDNLLSGNWVGAMLIAGLLASVALGFWHLNAGNAPEPPRRSSRAGSTRRRRRRSASPRLF